MEETQPDTRSPGLGASRGQDDPEHDADAAAGGRRAEASTEYAANAEPGTAADVDPREPPGGG